MQRKLRTILDTIHGSKWARIIPLCMLGALYIISMIIWHPAQVIGWFLPLILDAFAAGGMYFVNRLSSGTDGFKDAAVLFFSLGALMGTLMLVTAQPSWFSGEFNPGLGVGPAMFLGISLYHRHRMKKGS